MSQINDILNYFAENAVSFTAIKELPEYKKLSFVMANLSPSKIDGIIQRSKPNAVCAILISLTDVNRKEALKYCKRFKNSEDKQISLVCTSFLLDSKLKK